MSAPVVSSGMRSGRSWLQCAVRLRGTEPSQERAEQSAGSGVMRRRPVADTAAGTSPLLASSGDVGVLKTLLLSESSPTKLLL
jgi:hypothetical protein